MISNVLLLITFLTSSICFVELVKDKKKYHSLALVLGVILFVLFIRPILIIWYEYRTDLCALVLGINIALFLAFLLCLVLDNERLHNSKRSQIVLMLLILCIVSVILMNGFFLKTTLLVNNVPFQTINDSFCLQLKDMRTGDDMYKYIYENLEVVVINVFYIVMFILTFKTTLVSFGVLTAEKAVFVPVLYRNKTYILLFLLACIISLFFDDIIRCFFQEFEWLSPQV